MAATLGIISDTHGLVRPEAIAALQGCELIVHAGDIGKPQVLEELRQVAPVIAIRGNIDRDPWAESLRDVELFEHHKHYFYVLHDINQLDLDPTAAGIDVIIAGHSHQPKNEQKDGILYFNPGSAGPGRFKLPVSVGKIYFDEHRFYAEFITLLV